MQTEQREIEYTTNPGRGASLLVCVLIASAACTLFASPKGVHAFVMTPTSRQISGETFCSYRKAYHVCSLWKGGRRLKIKGCNNGVAFDYRNVGCGGPFRIRHLDNKCSGYCNDNQSARTYKRLNHKIRLLVSSPQQISWRMGKKPEHPLGKFAQLSRCISAPYKWQYQT
jgi:hypothetical protein